MVLRAHGKGKKQVRFLHPAPLNILKAYYNNTFFFKRIQTAIYNVLNENDNTALNVLQYKIKQASRQAYTELQNNQLAYSKDINNRYVQDYNKEKYDYNNLIKQDDIKIYQGSLENLDSASKQDLLLESKNKALSNGAISNDGYSYTVYNNRENIDIKVNQGGLLHTKNDFTNEKRNAIVNLGYLLSNAIKVNEAFRNNQYSSVYYNVMNLDNELYLVRMIVKDNDLSQLESHKLYAISSKKGMNFSNSQGYSLGHTSTISVKDLLNNVNSLKDANFSDVLSLDSLRKLNGDSYKVKPTDIKGLKYSKAVELSKTLDFERTPDLLAIHNLSEDKLRKSVELNRFGI